MHHIELWEAVPGYEGEYTVSDLGRVYSFKRGVHLKPELIRSGYHRVALLKKGVARKCLVHRLVMLAFVGSYNLDVNHIDGVKTNNVLNNLEYCTRSANIRHSYRIGTSSNAGERNPSAKLNMLQVRVIRKLSGLVSGGFIGNIFNVNRNTAYAIWLNKTWDKL